jgi:hypothetical protein
MQLLRLAAAAARITRGAYHRLQLPIRPLLSTLLGLCVIMTFIAAAVTRLGLAPLIPAFNLTFPCIRTAPVVW